MTLPTDAQDRKNVPIATGVIDYFPDALAAVAACSKKGTINIIQGSRYIGIEPKAQMKAMR